MMEQQSFPKYNTSHLIFTYIHTPNGVIQLDPFIVVRNISDYPKIKLEITYD